MKKVDRKFLEEQVKKAINEKEQEEQNWFMKALAKSGEAHSASVRAQVDAASMLGPMIWDIIKSLPFGSPSSYTDLIKWAQDTGTYGVGSQKYYKKIVDTLGPLQNVDARAPWGQQMIRFVNTAPITSDNAAQLNVVFKEDLQKDLVKLRDDTAKAIYLAIQSGKDVKKTIFEILRAKTYGYDPNIAATGVEAVFSWSQIRDAYVGPEDGTLADIADDYNFTKTWTDGLWGEPLKFGFINLFKDPRRFLQNGMYKEYSEEFTKLRSMPEVQEAVEKLIMLHFNGLEGTNFKQAYRKLINNSELVNIAKARASFETFNESGVAALIGIADIAVSVPTTVIMVISLMGGVTAPVGVGAAMGKAAAFKALRSAILKSTSKMKNAANAALTAKKFGMTIKSLSTLKAQAGPMIILFGQMGWDMLQAYLNDIDDQFKKFVDLCEDNKYTKEQKAAFFDENVKSAYGYIAKQHALMFSAAGFDNKYIVSQIAKPSYVRNLYINCNLSAIQELNQKITAVNGQMIETEKTVAKLSSQLGVLDKHTAGIEKASARADAILNSDTGMKVPTIIQTPTAVPKAVKSTKQAADPEKTSKFGGDEKTSDQILKNIQTSFGSNEKTSGQVLSDIENALGGAIQEQEEIQVISVNLGYRDAIEYAKGTEGFSPETTKANIDKIRKLVQSKGKQVKFTPVAALTDVPEGVDADKFKEFAKEINSHVQDKQVSTAKPAQVTQKPATEEPPSDREVTQGKDASGVSGPEILIIGDSTSNNIVDYNKILRRGKKEGREPGYYGKDGTRYYPKDFGGSHNKAAAAAKAAGGGAIFPGWSGHASHGAAGTTYIKNSLNRLLARDTSYVPKVAIISMGYNDNVKYTKTEKSVQNFKDVISALKQRGVKDIRIIEPRADKGGYKKNADLIRPFIYPLADGVVKIVPNPTTQDGGPPRGDGVHYTPAGARRLFKDAMGGLTVSSDVQASPSGAPDAGSSTKTTSQPARRAPTLKQNMESFGIAVDPRVENLFYQFGKKAIGYEPNQFDLHAKGISDLETANNSKRYMYINSSGYIGKYQLNGDWWYTCLLSRIRKNYGLEDLIPEGDIGYAEPDPNRRNNPKSAQKKEASKYGKRLSYKQFAKEIVKKDMWQIQEVLWAAMQAENGRASAGMDQRSRAGYLAISHNIGGPTGNKWVEAKKGYLKTKDPRYLMYMWSMQDGNHTPGEKFLRNSARKVYGAKFIKLPQGKHEAFADIYVRENPGKRRPRPQSTFGNSFNPGKKLEVYEEYWNKSTGNADIFKYYKKDGSPEGDAGSLVSGQVSAAVGSSQPTKKGRVNTTASKTQAKSIEQQISKLAASNDLNSFAVAYSELLGMSFGSARRNLTKMISAERQLNSSDISGFVKQRTNYLKMIHRKKYSTWKQEYDNDIKDPDKKAEADKKMAFYHRPIFYVTAYTRDTKKFFSNSPEISFAFEPTINRVAVSYASTQVFYRQDIMGNQVFSRFMRELALLKKATNTAASKIDPVVQANPNKGEILNDVKNYITKFNNIVNTVHSGLEDPSNSASRKAYLVSILNLAMLTT